MDEATPAIRVSDRERSDTMQQLCEAFAEGRLGQADFEVRTDRALRAVTHADLRMLTSDLPVDQRSVTRAERAEFLLETRWWVAGAVVMNGIWLVQSLVADSAVRYWPVLPLAIWALLLIGAVIAPRSPTKAAGKPAPAVGELQTPRPRTPIDLSGTDAAPREAR